MSFDTSEWNVDIGKPSSATFPLSRYLEYTDTDLEAQLKPVSNTTLEWHTQYPTVFMSELTYNREDSSNFVHLRVGNIFQIGVNGAEISYYFTIEKDFGRIVLASQKNFESAFELGRLEIHRTHWAVKRGEIELAFIKANIVPPAPLPPIPPLPAIPIPLTPNLHQETPQVIVESVRDYMEYILELHVPAEYDVFYRGHSNVKYRLEPSLFRKTPTGEYRFLQHEAQMIRELLTTQARAFSEDEYMLDRLVRMQHFGLPTRLLDVTSNPLVALYFCCSELQLNKEEGNEIDGEVIILTTPSSNVKFFDSDTVSCIANLALMEDEAKNQLNTNLKEEDFNALPQAERLLHLIRREKPYFNPRIKPKDLERIIFVRGRNIHERISSQSGAFLIFGKDSVLPETGHSALEIRRIIVRKKTDILDELSRLNIKSSTVYPGLEKTTAEIAKKYEPRSPNTDIFS